MRAILAGKARVENASEGVYFTMLCENYQWLGGATMIYEQTFKQDLNLLPADGPSHYFRAARYGVLGGTGPTDDRPPLGPADRARLRGQALAWLRTELDIWKNRLRSGASETRIRASETFRIWKQDVWLAGVRTTEALAKLPAQEREAWQAFWSELDQLLAREV